MSRDKRDKPTLVIKLIVVAGITWGFVISELKEVVIDIKNKKEKIKSKIKKA